MKTIFEKSNGIDGITLTDEPINLNFIPKEFVREEDIKLPQMSELEVMRHYKSLSDKNFCIEKGFYPLGSCTMKYNPKVNEYLANLEDFNIHPNMQDEDIQGSLKLMYNLQNSLLEITGMDAITLQPSAGAHGEMTGMMIIKQYFKSKGEIRKKVIIPDSAHGTNPASAKMCGFDIVEIKSNEKGQVDIQALKDVLDSDVAAIMMTNPNTLGIFEENVLEISKIMHENGSLLYYDGANFNAIMGYTNPKLMGFDVVHLNLHKTFATPHGGGGPGAGVVAVVNKLKDFLPIPTIKFNSENNLFYRNYNIKNTIGSVKGFCGNFSVFVKAYAYILMMGKNLKYASENAVLNANYIKEKLKEYYELPINEPCMHEFVLCLERLKKETGVSAMDIAKASLDYGMHPATMYFPLIVHEALMFEPAETESKETIDEAVNIYIELYNKALNDPEYLHNAPHNCIIGRPDDTAAARNPILKYSFDD